MKLNTIGLFVAVSLHALLTTAQTPGQTAMPIQAGKGIATVPTESGSVRGYIHNGTTTFKGIPYAQAGRFMAPEKPAPWTTVRSSTVYGPVCPIDAMSGTGADDIEFAFQHNWGVTNENCLSLNVWTPQATTAKKRPVMVWLHGGGFAMGSSMELPSYDGENLAKKGDVVVVSVNHRLNVLGFLDLSAYGDKYKNSANAGLMDLVTALQWVKQNISQFGGDPANVTIFGQSGGGGKVTCLMNAPSAKGLFQKAIVQSGSYVSNFMDQGVARQVSAALLSELNLQPTQVDSLQTIPYERLLAASRKALQKVNASAKASDRGTFGVTWGPIHDGNFLPYQPADAAAIALSTQIPLLVGSTKTEFGPFNPANRASTMEQAKAIAQQRYGDKADAYLAAVKKDYPETTLPADYINIDTGFRAGAIQQAGQKAATGKAPVYMYLFTWSSPVNDGMYKSMHCMEMPFMFDNISRCEEMTGGSQEAHTLADKMSRAWIAFARTGNPNHKGLPNWPTYTAEGGATMLFDRNCQVKPHPDKDVLSAATGKSM